MSTPSHRFVQGKFAEYYREYASEIEPPSFIEQREFGFLLFRERIMLRHKSFRTMEDFRSFVQRVTPSDVYYSAAYYERPEAEMDEKGWLGADLIFDIDADHIPTPCNKVHDTWLCGNCGAAGRGVPPATCPACGGQKFDEKTWPCEVCLTTAKAETIKLMDFLTKDFGFSLGEIRVFFSGHRGYHLQVESEEVRTLDQLARSEMVDYILGVGLEPQFHGLVETFGERRFRTLRGPDLSDPGWRGRIAKGTYDFLLTASQEDLEKIGLKRKAAEAIIKNREILLRSWREKGPWGTLQGIGMENWKRIAQQGAERQSARIDTVVTTDIHRLLRFNKTLHGKTALKKTEVPLTSIEDFDPFQDAIAFKRGTVTLFVEEAPEFRLGNMVYGPYKGQRVELPMAAALLLLCKGLAKVAEER
ncbi:MAG: DNA primase small subunit PriS [Candidatus Bathyarchaeia archaeon]